MAVTGYTAPGYDPTQSGVDYGSTAQRAEEQFYEKKKQEEASRVAQEQATAASQQNLAAADQATAMRQYQQDLAAAAAGGGTQAEIAKAQRDFIAALQRQASGEQPGAAQLQLQRALQGQLAATASQVGSQRGLNPATAQRMLVQQQTQQQQATAGMSAEAALAEQQRASELLNTALGQTRGQDIAAQQATADILAGVRQQDIGAAAQAAQAAAAQREADLRAQAQALGLYDSAGKLDIAKTQQVIDQKLAYYKAQFDAGLITAQQLYKEENYWRDFWADVSKDAIAAAGDAFVAFSGGAGKAVGTVAGGAYSGGKISSKSSSIRLKNGDHPDNDIVPAMLSPGEIVIPRSIAMSDNAPDKAKAFVAALQRSEGKMLSRQSAAKKISELEAEIAALKAMRSKGKD